LVLGQVGNGQAALLLGEASLCDQVPGSPSSDYENGSAKNIYI
jgi:hypothetical protein